MTYPDSTGRATLAGPFCNMQPSDSVILSISSSIYTGCFGLFLDLICQSCMMGWDKQVVAHTLPAPSCSLPLALQLSQHTIVPCTHSVIKTSFNDVNMILKCCPSNLQGGRNWPKL